MYIGAVERISYYIDAENSNGRKENCKFFFCGIRDVFSSSLLLSSSVFFLLSLLRVTNVHASVLYMNESYGNLLSL